MTSEEVETQEDWAQRIAQAVSDAWPNGYNHRDHFPKAVAVIQPLVDGILAAGRAQGRAEGREEKRREDLEACQRIGFKPLMMPVGLDKQSFIRGAQMAIDLIAKRITEAGEGNDG
jgi:hypothetical protein